MSIDVSIDMSIDVSIDVSIYNLNSSRCKT